MAALWHRIAAATSAAAAAAEASATASATAAAGHSNGGQASLVGLERAGGRAFAELYHRPPSAMRAASAAARPAAAAAPAPAPQLRCAGLCGIAAGKAVGEQQQAEQAELQLLLLPLERSSRQSGARSPLAC